MKDGASESPFAPPDDGQKEMDVVLFEPFELLDPSFGQLCFRVVPEVFFVGDVAVAVDDGDFGVLVAAEA